MITDFGDLAGEGCYYFSLDKVATVEKMQHLLRGSEHHLLEDGSYLIRDWDVSKYYNIDSQELIERENNEDIS